MAAREFTLTVDDRVWSLPTSGDALEVDRYAPASVISAAEHRIVFAVGEWRRELRPAPILKTFVQDCARRSLPGNRGVRRAS